MTGDSSPTYDTSDIDRLDPQDELVELTSGTKVKIVPLKTRQFFKLLRIITHGGAGMIPQLSFSADMDESELAGQLIGLVVFAIPDAEDETIDFVKSMVLPEGFPTGNRKEDEKILRELDTEFQNPEIEDLLIVIEAIIKRESGDLKALGNRIAAMMKGAAASNQIALVETVPTTEPEAETQEPSQASLEVSPAPST